VGALERRFDESASRVYCGDESKSRFWLEEEEIRHLITSADFVAAL
jgi:hypothetical protein